MPANLPFVVREESRNIHTVELIGNSTTDEWTFVLASDIHWDSTHCDRDAWDKVLRQANKNNWGVFVWGDMFDLMQGRHDPRRARQGVRPEFDHSEYLDAVIEGCATWHRERNENGNILLLSRGNHEESIRKNLDSDPIQRTVSLMNYGTPHRTYSGGYGGWVRFMLEVNGRFYSLLLKYHHGSGGAPIMSHGTLGVVRQAAVCPDADVVCSGHIHRRWVVPLARERLVAGDRRGPRVQRDTQYHVCCGSMKDSFGDGADGWEVEKGLPPKETGCVLMKLFLERSTVKNHKDRTQMRYALRPEFTLTR